MELLAILAAFVASLTGMIAVGCGRRFAYTPQQLASGDPVAMAYVWVCGSTVASAFHATALLDAAARESGQSGLFGLVASTGCSLLFAAAHVVVGRWADRRNGVARHELAN